MSKKDLNQPATKGDLAKVESGFKAEIAAVEQKLDQKIERVYSSQVQAGSELGRKIDRVSDKMDKLHSDLMSAFEATVVKGEKYDQKAVTHAGILMEHTEKLSDHETRITTLEKK